MFEDSVKHVPYFLSQLKDHLFPLLMVKQRSSDPDNSSKLLYGCGGQFEVGLCIERALL